jgi:cytochrome c biogenesis protein CcmG, thiol:disulfide interchange protein DsbE
MWKRLLVAGAVTLPLVALLAFGFTRNAREIPSPLVGKPAPAFELALFDGGTARLEDLRGKVVFVNFWASWCPPCRDEARMLEAAWQAYRDRDVVFVGANIQDQEPNARAFLEEFGVTYPNGIDRGSRVAIDYGVWGLPETFIIDRTGRITYKHVGGIGWATLTARLDEALQGTARPGEGKGEYRAIR